MERPRLPGIPTPQTRSAASDPVTAESQSGSVLRRNRASPGMRALRHAAVPSGEKKNENECEKDEPASSQNLRSLVASQKLELKVCGQRTYSGGSPQSIRL